MIAVLDERARDVPGIPFTKERVDQPPHFLSNGPSRRRLARPRLAPPPGAAQLSMTSPHRSNLSVVHLGLGGDPGGAAAAAMDEGGDALGLGLA